MKFDPKSLKKVRDEFIGAEMDPAGKQRAFLDNGAGTLVCRMSAEMEQRARVNWSANVGNPFYESRGAEATIHEGRQAVADLLGAEGPDNIVSGEAATSLLFNLSYAIGRDLTGEENVVTTGYEHYANVNPWIELGNSGRIDELKFADFDRETGELEFDKLEQLVDENTVVITATAASNVLGTRTDLKRIAKLAQSVDAYFVVDAVHHVAHGLTDVKDIGCDFLVFSGYKLFSRHGSFMYMGKRPMEELMPYKVLSSPAHGPEKWEWGTRDQAMFAAATGAVDYISWLGDPAATAPPNPGTQRRARLKKAFESIEEYEKSLSDVVLNGQGKIPGLLDIRGLRLYGPKGLSSAMGRDPTFSFKIEGLDDRELSKLLYDRYSVAIGAEDYFSRVPVLYNEKTMLRATFVHYNTKAEAMALLTALDKVTNKKKKH